MDETILTLVLVVKGDATVAKGLLDANIGVHLNRWFTEDMHPPYGEGALLFWGVSGQVHRKDNHPQEPDDFEEGVSRGLRGQD